MVRCVISLDPFGEECGAAWTCESEVVLLTNYLLPV
jgi:hypothetical protein